MTGFLGLLTFCVFTWYRPPPRLLASVCHFWFNFIDDWCCQIGWGSVTLPVNSGKIELSDKNISVCCWKTLINFTQKESPSFVGSKFKKYKICTYINPQVKKLHYFKNGSFHCEPIVKLLVQNDATKGETSKFLSLSQ